MGTKTIRVWNGASQSSKDAKLYTSLSSINSALNSAGLPDNCIITSAKLKVNAGYSGGISPKIYMTFGLGNTSAFNVTLFSRTQISNGSTYPSSGVEIINYFADKEAPGFALNLANYGSYFVVRLDTANIATPTMKVNWVDIDITYEIPTYTITFKNHDGTTLQTVSVQRGTTPSYTGSTPTKSQDAQYTYTFSGWSPAIAAATGAQTYTAQFSKTTRSYTISAIASPVTGGTITGSGTYNYTTSATVTLSATAGADYEFLRWNDGVTSNSRTISVTGDKSYIAYFRLNKIYVNTSRLAGILVDTTAATEVYKDTTKVFG